MAATDLSPQLEMYLKTIHDLAGKGSEVNEKTPVRMKDIAESMQVTVPSASEAIRALKAKGYLLHKSYGPVRLTTRGARKAEELAERFSILRQFLVDVLKVSPPTADQEACEIEHVVGPDTLTRLNAYLVFLMQCGQDTARLTQHFHEFLENYLAGEACPDCGVTPATLKMDSASGS